MNKIYCPLALALLAISSSALAATPTCQSSSSDPDGDGWGWENSASCTFSAEVTTTTATPQRAQIDVSGVAICTSADADPDGDGWGWENSASCVTGSLATDAPANSTNTTTSTVDATTANGLPVCSSTAFDQDGDGWGWENNATCVIGVSSVTAPGEESQAAENTNNNTSSSTEVAANGLPVCTSPTADEDGDGWGWENNASCAAVASTNTTTEPAAQEVVDTTTTETNTPAEPVTRPACSLPSSDPNNDGWGWENNQVCVAEILSTVNIMAVGDSITHGYSVDQAASYRQPFVELLTSNECQFEMVGSQTGNHFHDSFVSPHEGYNAHTADNLLNGLSDVAGNNEGISVTASRYQPNVVLLHAGSNDMRLRQNIDGTVAEIDQIISIILAQDSSPVVFVANVIPWYSNASIGADVETLGDRIEAYVSQLGNSRVQLVDVRSGYEPSMMLSDGVHPNPTGEAFIADKFFDAYNAAGFCR